jgi:hypothetical protein
VYLTGPHLLGVLRFPQWEGKFTAAYSVWLDLENPDECGD